MSAGSTAGRISSFVAARRRQAQARAMELFGLEAGKHVRKDLVRRVWKGEVKYARRLTASRTVIVLDYAGEEVAFLYSNSSKEILSFLAPDAPEMEDWRNSQTRARGLFRGSGAQP